MSSVMLSVLAQSAVDRGFDPDLGQTRDYEIDICCFSAKHAALRSKRTGLFGIRKMCPSGATCHVYPQTVVSGSSSSTKWTSSY